MKHHSMKRRDFLKAGALAAGGALLASRLAFANTATNAKGRLVFVILRGALDGLAAVPPYGDRDYARLRGDLALPGGSLLPLNDLFGLHPSLTFLKESFTARELVVFHAVASPYRERSHFDGQDVLESGNTRPHAAQSGWLNRALAAMPARQRNSKELGVALGQNVPLVMRGPADVTSWSPSKLAALDEDTLQRIADLYAGDPILAARLADAQAADAIAETNISARSAMMVDTTGIPANGTGAPGTTAAAAAVRGGAARYTEVIHAAAEFLTREDGPKVAVFDTTGWDTHANEGGVQGQLAGRLTALDTGLRSLKEQMGEVWSDTTVLLATEFGRTAAINGTRGTDHGTAAAAFLVGGAVNGGRVIADWPGLSSRALYQGRDLQPTLDLRAVLKGLLADQLHIPAKALDSTVFPDSDTVRALDGLVKT